MLNLPLVMIVNPVAGRGRGLKIGNELHERLDSLGVPHIFHTTRKVGEATALAHASPDNALVLSVGGDGTVQEVSRAVVQSGRTLAVIPGGTGNDYARALGIPSGHLAALDYVLSRTFTRKMDAIRVNESDWLFNAGGTGFDTEVVHKAQAFRFLGAAAYLAGVFAALASFSYREVELEIDSQVLKQNYLLACVGNGKCYGGGMKVNPEGKPDDGVMELIICRQIPKYKIPILLPRFVAGTHLNLPIIDVYKCRELTIRGNKLLFHLDGTLSEFSELRFRLVPGAISVL